MKWLTTTGSALLSVLFIGCGSDKKDNAKPPTFKDGSHAFEDNETRDQSDYSAVDPDGMPYNPNADIDLGNANSQPAYDVQSEQYYTNMQQYPQTLNRPYQNYAEEIQRPYLEDRYNDHRSFLGQGRGFEQITPGQGRWNQQQYGRVHGQMQRSKRWINYDLYNLINRTLRCFKQRNYRSHNHLENNIYDAFRRRDHGGAVRYHDQLLNEYRGRQY